MRHNEERYMPRRPLPKRRPTWRQKVDIIDAESGRHEFYVDFGEYPDGTLGEIFITAKKLGSFVRGVLDSLARAVSLALQTGTSPHDMARQLRGQDYPPQGQVESRSSSVTECSSIADYVGSEILASYGEDGRRRPMYEAGDNGRAEDDLAADAEPGPAAAVLAGKAAGYVPEAWRTGV